MGIGIGNKVSVLGGKCLKNNSLHGKKVIWKKRCQHISLLPYLPITLTSLPKKDI
jgi:hypothetical protein